MISTAPFAPISLKEMQAVGLMSRVDTKYAVGTSMLNEVLEAVSDRYRVQTINGVWLAGYRSLYLDTPSLDMYLQHHNGKKERKKVRLREYTDSALAWFEVKQKSNHGRTDKVRIQLPDIVGYETLESARFVGSHTEYELMDLCPQLANSFSRITLANNNLTERVTIDTGIRFECCRTGVVANLGSIAVIEVKQSGAGASAIKDELFSRRVRPLNLSKYCVGIVLTGRPVKHNRFKEKLRQLGKITG